MALGFWRLAAEDPERIALVAPDGDEVTAGDLLAESNRIAHGLRSLGIETGDTVACVLPNGRAMIALYLGAMQIGVYLTPINHHLVGPEIAYIVNDSDAKVLIGDEHFADELVKARTEIDLGDDALFATGTVGGFRSWEALQKGQPSELPENRVAGSPMHYTSGTTGKPKGVKRGIVEIDPDDFGELYAGFQSMFGVDAEYPHVHIDDQLVGQLALGNDLLRQGRARHSRLGMQRAGPLFPQRHLDEILRGNDAQFFAAFVADDLLLSLTLRAHTILGPAGDPDLAAFQVRGKLMPSGMLGPGLESLLELVFPGLGDLRFHLGPMDTGFALQQFQLGVAQLLTARSVLGDAQQTNLFTQELVLDDQPLTVLEEGDKTLSKFGRELVERVLHARR
jgi:hypothetical protein